MIKQSVIEKIRQRRLQILVHSCIYYKYNENIISDAKWNEWANELVELQKKYPAQSMKADMYDVFKDFDGSTGFDLPIDDLQTISRAEELLSHRQLKLKPVKPQKKAKASLVRKLF